MPTNSMRARALLIVATIGLSFVMLNCSNRDQPQFDAASALLPFKQGLLQALKAGLEEGGPTNAMTACNLQAPGIAEANSIDGLKVGRSSHKLRNPNNAPSEWVTESMEIMLENAPNRTVYGSWSNSMRFYRYAEPIYVQPMCLPCHGEAISEEVSAILAELYPDDQAVGFKEGDFRGVFWLEYTWE